VYAFNYPVDCGPLFEWGRVVFLTPTDKYDDANEEENPLDVYM
jgi:hypothetical protein